MKQKVKILLANLLAIVVIASNLLVVTPTTVYAATASFVSVGGWNEAIYAQISGVNDSNVTAVSYSGPVSGSLTGDDLNYLVRDYNGGVRIDIPGLKPGTYTLTVTTTAGTLTKSGLVVTAYDRSGYAHFNYTAGVGAYNDDGTLKDNAIVLYVTDENKNSVTLSYGGVTVTGIGNILNTSGKDVGSGATSKGGKPNTNQDILKKLANANIPLVVRFVGCVSNTGLYKQGSFTASSTPKINGLTIYDSVDYGGSVGDNGHMARMQSGKDITLEGIGTDATIDGWGFHFMCSTTDKGTGRGTSFETRNLTFINTPEDGVGMEGTQGTLKADGTVENASSATADILGSVERCWVHNCEFYCPNISGPAESDKAQGDGSVDFKRGQYFTCSYNYFEGCHKTNLVGSSDTSLQYNLTYHHNYWKNCGARGPLARRANIHMYNNVFEGQTDYCMNPRATCFIFSEYNLFFKCKNPQDVAGGALKSYNDSFSSCIGNITGTKVNDRKTTVSNSCEFSYRGIDYSKFETDSNLSYIPTGDYAIQEDITEVRKYIAAYNGTMSEKVVTPAEASGSDYSVITALGASPTEITTFPFSATPGKLSKQIYAFKVNTPVTINTTFSSGVLINEAGEAILESSGSITVPAGTYAIQPLSFNAKAFNQTDFKEVTISSISITAADPSYDPNKLVSIALDKSSATLLLNGTTTLNVSYTPSTTTSDKTVTWTTSNSSVATVSNGVVTAVGKGTAVITAKVGDCTATCNVTVSDPVALTGISLNKTTLSLESGSTEVLEVTCNPSNTTDDTTVTWTSGNTSVATVSGGTVKAVGEGTTTITAKVGNFTAVCTVTVTVPEIPEGTQIYTYGCGNSYFTVAGSSKTGLNATIEGTTLTQALKLNSDGSLTFTTVGEADVVVYVQGAKAGNKFKIDSTEFTVTASADKYTATVGSGSHTIIRISGESYLYYVAVTEKSGPSVEPEADADYSAVDAAIATVPSDLTKYTDSTAAAVTAAVNAVVRGKKVSEQSVVDGYATAITNAVNALVLKNTDDKNGLNKASDGKWYYYENGAVNTNKTGIVENNAGKWFVENGVLDFNKSGVIEDNGVEYVVKYGYMSTGYYGLTKKDDGSWAYAEAGVLTYKYTGLAKNDSGWWYVTNGVIDFTYTGIGTNQTGSYRVQNGQLDFSYNGWFRASDGEWYYIRGGMVDTDKNGLQKLDDKYYYLTKGQIDFKYTGLAENAGVTYYVKYGYLDFSFSGTVTVDGVEYNVKNGIVQ